MAAVTVCSDFGAQETMSLFPFSPLIYLSKVMGLDAMIVVPLSDIKQIHKLGKPPPVSSYDMFP